MFLNELKLQPFSFSFFLRTKSSKASDKTKRSKREPGVALVLSIIDKNSPKIQKLEIGMDDDGYTVNDRNSKLRSAVGKRLLSELLTKGDVQIKSEVDDDAKKHKWEELLEILKGATKCKDRKLNNNDDKDRHSFKPQKNKQKPHPRSSDDDKLDMILKLLENLKHKDDEELDVNGSEEEHIPETHRYRKPHHHEMHDEDFEEPIKRKPKPHYIEVDSTEESSNQIKRKSKPDHIVSEEEPEEAIQRKPKPVHIVRENSEEEP